jgi:hypothetical protein
MKFYKHTPWCVRCERDYYGCNCRKPEFVGPTSPRYRVVTRRDRPLAGGGLALRNQAAYEAEKKGSSR